LLLLCGINEEEDFEATAVGQSGAGWCHQGFPVEEDWRIGLRE
jgi:hypothetical protein